MSTFEASGQITMAGSGSTSSLEQFFGVATSPYTSQISLSQLYRGGTYVLNTGANSAIPTSGQISMSEFYSSVNVLPGNSWTAGTITASTISAVTYGTGSQWVIVGGNSSSTPVIFTSSNNAVTFASETIPSGLSTTYNFEGVTYGNSIYVISGVNLTGGDTAYFATSSDGVTWTTGATIASPSVATRISFGNGTFIASSGFSSGLGYYYSTNGTSWNSASTWSETGYAGFGATWDGSQWIGLGGTSVCTSPTGSTWTHASTITATGLTTLLDVAYNGFVYVVCGNGGYVGYATSPSGPWTQLTTTFSSTSVITKLAVGNGKTVMVGSVGGSTVNNGYIANTSSPVFVGGGTVLSNANLQSVAFGNGIFVTISSSGVAYSS